jgi:SAM-dependent methyltransferase
VAGVASRLQALGTEENRKSVTSSAPDFAGVTEMAGDPASKEQIVRLHSRYYWAEERTRGGDVLELGCGAGQGLGYLARTARRVVGSDVSETLVATASAHYGDRIEIRCFGAEQIPYPDGSFDSVLLFEAIYYVPDVSKFLREAHRVLRPKGRLLIVTANKDLFDFTPSPYSVAYYGVSELTEMLHGAGFNVSFFGNTPVDSVSSRQRLLRPLKRIATATGIMPKSKRMKALVKRFVFGAILPLPAEVVPGADVDLATTPLTAGVPDFRHKVLFVEARRRT